MNELQKQSKAIMETSGRGFEAGIDKEERITPRAKLLQDQTPEVKQNRLLSPDKQNLNLQPGKIVNSVTLEPLGTLFIPIIYWREFTRFNAMEKSQRGFDKEFDPGAFMWTTKNPDDPRIGDLAEFGPNGERPVVQRNLNFLSYFPEADNIAIITFSKTSYKTGKKLINAAATFGGDLFSRQYRLKPMLDNRPAGSFYKYEYEFAGLVNENMFPLCENVYRIFKDTEIKTTPEVVEEQEVSF